jgi:GntR family transcriptional regulator of arabinose operon
MQVRTSQKVGSVYADIRRRIEAGEWKKGERLPTAADLAVDFGCSAGVVSKAIAMLAHERFVEQKTKIGTRVLSGAPTSTSSSSMNAFSFIYPSRRHEGISRLARGFETAAHSAGRQVVMLSYGLDFQKEVEFISRLIEFDVRGAVIYPILASAADQIRFSQLVLNARFPIVLAEVNLLGMERPSVTIDGHHAGYTMTRHLLEGGSRRIGFLANDSRVTSIRDRYLGYRAAMESAGITIGPKWVCIDSLFNPDFEHPLVEPAELGSRYLKSCGHLDAVVCANDFIALGLIKAAAEAGINVPRDLKVTGMDDIAAANLGDTPLTTYHSPFEEMGAKTFSLLDAVYQKQKLDSLETQLRGTLIIRASSL